MSIRDNYLRNTPIKDINLDLTLDNLDGLDGLTDESKQKLNLESLTQDSKNESDPSDFPFEQNTPPQSPTGADQTLGDQPTTTISPLAKLAIVRNNVQRTDMFSNVQGSFQYPSTPMSEIKRYDRDFNVGKAAGLDFVYGRDNENYQAENEGFFENLGKGLIRLPASIEIKVGQTAGFLTGLLNPKNWGDGYIQNASNNAITQFFNELDEDMKNNWLPVYEKAGASEKGFWWRATHDMNFWTNDFVDGAAFMISAFAPGAFLSKIGLGERIAKGVSALKYGAAAADDVVQGAGKVQNYLSKAQTIWADRVNKVNQWALSVAGEAMFEATEAGKNIKQGLTYDKNGQLKINPETGSPYTEEEKKKIVGSQMKSSFLANAALLSVTNALELKWLNQLTGKAEKTAVSKALKGGSTLGEALEYELKNQGISKLLNSNAGAFLKAVGRGILVEGYVEENMQLAIQRVNETAGIEGKVASFKQSGEMIKKWGKQTVQSFMGKDPEASLSIGLGGILGGGMSGVSGYKESKSNKAFTQAAIKFYNDAQQSLYKFGNIYKTETVVTKDAEGKDVSNEQIVLDNNGRAIIDEKKLFNAVNNFNNVNSAVEAGNLLEDKFKRDILRDSAWGSFTMAHIQLGIEDTLIKKLDAISRTDSSELIKLGFVGDESTAAQIQKYKNLTNLIINQNKILNNDIIFEKNWKGQLKPEEQARKNRMTELATQQAVYKSIVSDMSAEALNFKNDILKVVKDQVGLTDDFVDQLNSLQLKIDSQKQYLEDLKTMKRSPIDISMAKSVLDDLSSELEDLKKNNSETLKKLQKDSDGYYNYENNIRNQPIHKIVRNSLYSRYAKIGGIENHIKKAGMEWARYADTKNGKENFKEYIDSVVTNPLKKSFESAETDSKEKPLDTQPPSDLKTDEKKDTSSLPPLSSDSSKPLSLAEKKALLKEKMDKAKSIDDKAFEDYKDKIQELRDQGNTAEKAVELVRGEWLLTPEGIEFSKLSSEIEKLQKEIQDEEGAIPSLEEYLKQKFENLKENPDFKEDSFEEWRISGKANGFIRDYNRKYGKKESGTEISSSPGIIQIDDIDTLDIKKATMKDFQVVSRAIRKIYDTVASDAQLLNKLLDKINEIEDDFLKTSLMQVFKTKSTPTNYIPLSSVGIDVNFEEHTVYDRINMPLEEFLLGFTLQSNSDILNILSASTGDITSKVVAIASLEFIRKSQKKLTDANIPNRTIITSETPKDIAKLNKGIPVIAKASRSDGFNLQLFLNDQSIPGNAYVAGISNYAIVYPDNTTEKIEWTEEQREFVKNNLLVDGQKMTDQQYNTLQEMYKKMQAFEARVMPLLEEYVKLYPNEDSIDVTSLFKDVFTLSGKFTATKGESLQEIIKRAGPDRLFRVQVADEQNNVSERLLPLFAFVDKDVLRFEFPLDSGTRIVTVDENNDVQEVLSLNTYLKEEQGINVEITDEFPGNRAWISKSENKERGYTPYKLSVDKTQSSKSFKEFASSFRELKQAIAKGLAEDKNIFVYRGQTYNSLDAMMVAFNKNHYGFYQYNGFVANFGYNPKAKVNGKAVGKFLLEIRPQNKDERNALTPAQKKALNIYISDSAMAAITDETSDDKFDEIYGNWMQSLIKDFNKFFKNIQKSDDPILRNMLNPNQTKVVDGKELKNFIDYHLLFEYDLVNDVRNFKLKLVNKLTSSKDDISQIYPFLKFDGRSIGVSEKNKNTKDHGLRLSFNDSSSIVTSAPVIMPPPVSGKKEEASTLEGASPENTFRPIADELNPDDDPFMLEEETEENYEKYTEASFNSEIEWLKTALGNTGIRLEDLGTILNNLFAKKQVLGYYKNKAIYVNQALSKRGTIYHEAFHGLFRDILTQSQRNFYIEKARVKVGYISDEKVNKFRDDRGYFNKTDDEIRTLIYEEYLADGFRKWKLEKKEPKEGWFKKLINIIDRIINFFTSKKNEIEDLYQDFDAGKYANINKQPSTISQEGVYSIAYSRPKLFLKPGAQSFTQDNTRILNLNLQNELVYKIVSKVSTISQGSFNEKFQLAVEDVKKDYNIEDLVKDSEYADAIRAKYSELFYDALYILGENVPFVLSEDIKDAADAKSYRTQTGSNEKSLEIVKKLVKEKINALGLQQGLDVENLKIPESDEDRVEREKGGEFDTIHMNPLEGLSKEFRSLFSTIPYDYVDEALGVTIKKMADGKMLYDAMLKIVANTPLDQILPSLAKAVAAMQEDNDRNSVQLKAFQNFIQKQFGIPDISVPGATASKNIHLYKQFIDTFFITELPSKQVVLKTTKRGSEAQIFDSSIKADMDLKKEKIKYHYEQSYRRLTTEQEKEDFEKKFQDLKTFILGDLLKSLNNPSVVNARTKSLNLFVNKTKKMLDDVNIILPKSLIRQSFLAIYNIQNELEFSPQSLQNRLDMETDQRLMKEGAYLQKEFFSALATISRDNIPNIFADTKDSIVNVGNDVSKIKTINAVLKKSMKYVIKYDVNSAISTYQNAENKKIWRYSRYTPPILIAQMVREYGIEALTDIYPVLREWYSDNPLFDDSFENKLFLENLQVESFGGFRQEVDDDSKVGSTFGNIDSKSLLISNIVHFMNRETITKKMKGSKDAVSIVTFSRSRTQEEATTTNFLITGRYQKLVTKEGRVGLDMINTFEKMLEQEYNRIAREWSNRENSATTRYLGYNDNVHPETGAPILGDSYTKMDGKTVMLRAYQFKNFEHFFNYKKSDSQPIREEIKLALLELAKQGLTFEEALKKTTENSGDVTIEQLLKGSSQVFGEFEKYLNETFKVYKNKLVNLDIIEQKTNGVIKSDLIPSTIKLDFTEPKPIQDYGYENIDQLLMDHHLNVFMNKMLVNQIFDGDIATGIKSVSEYFKRNKLGVISGNSLKSGYFRAATVQNITADINSDDLTQLAKEVTEETPSDNKEDIADGQSWHTLNHRIRMLDSLGRVDAQVRSILNAKKYRKLTYQEVKTLENRKVVLNTLKTATGAILEYFKLSEHLVSRTEVSHLVIPSGMEKEEVYDILDDLYTQIETLEDMIIEDPYREDVDQIESEIEDLYKEVHKYWEPKKSRSKLHYMLNSMELSGIDMLFDPNASKKTKVIPVKLNSNDVTNLKPGKSLTQSLFKFMQVETSGIKKKISLPTQARQLLTTYINKLNTKAYNNKSLKQLAAEYSATLGEITEVNTKMLDARMLDRDGNINITELYKMMYEGLKKQGADENTLKFFEIRNGKPVFNPNLLTIKQIFTYYYFSMFNDAVFSEEVSGRSDILVSSYGHELLYDTETGEIITGNMQERNPDLYKSERYQTRPLGISVETIDGVKVYTVEVIIPEPLMKNESEKKLFLEKMNKFFSTRIPTEDKRSMIVSKVVDFMEGSYQNSIVVPQLIHILAGSDLDVDKLFSHTFAYYVDYNNEAHIYGDYEGYKTDSQGRFVEYINYMMNDNRVIKDSLDAEIEKVSEKPVFTADFINLKDELGLSDMTYTAEELKEKRKEIATIIDVLTREAKDLQITHDILFESHLKLNARKGSKLRADWVKSRKDYKQAMQRIEEKEQELEIIKKEEELLNNTIKLAALVNVLKSMNLPTTKAGLTSYISKNGNITVPVLHNKSLQQKIDMLSNEEVFNNFYIKEKSSSKAFSDVAELIGASVEDVVSENSINSIMGDLVANELNSSSKDGIGISASFNKFLAFAEKNDLSLTSPLFGTSTEQGLEEHSNFLNKDGVRNIGNQLGMFADAGKDPIPSVLNLNPKTSSSSNLLLAMSGNVQLGILINKIPFIEEITQEVINYQSNAQSPNAKIEVKTIKTLLNKRIIKPLIFDLQEAKRLGELYKKDKDDEIIFGAMLPMYIETAEPNKNLANMNPDDITLRDVGFIIKYEDGSPVLEDVAKIYVATVYSNTVRINGDIIKLGTILNLIKSQNPDFNAIDNLLENFEYFMSGNSIFGESIVKIFASSTEYLPLIAAARKLSDYSKQVLIERTPLFKSINSILQMTFSNARDPKSRKNISDQITKLILIQKTKVELQNQLKNLQGKTDNISTKKKEFYENVLKYFTADYWINNNTFIDDLDYLYSVNQGNPFVEFLKVNVRGNIDFLEGSTRIKLDKDIAENINNGFEALEKSSDRRTRLLAKQFFYYLVLKDGLGYSNNSFISYVNPNMASYSDPNISQYEEVSKYLDDFQELLLNQQEFINKQNSEIEKIRKSGLNEKEKDQKIKKIADKVYENYLKLFDEYYKTETPGKIDWINIIVRKIVSNSNNQRYIRQYYGSKTEEQRSKEYVNTLISLGVFSNISVDTEVSGKRFDFSTEAESSFSVNFEPISDSPLDPEFEYVFGNIFIPTFKDRDLFSGVYFPTIIKNSEDRLFKLTYVDGRSTSEDIAYQSITGRYIGTSGLKAEYREIKIEGAKGLLNFGFTQEDGISLYEHSQTRYEDSEEYQQLESGADPSNISDNISNSSVQRKLDESGLPESMQRSLDERRRRSQIDQDVTELPESMRLSLERRRKKQQEESSKGGPIMFGGQIIEETDELPESMRRSLEKRKGIQPPSVKSTTPSGSEERLKQLQDKRKTEGLTPSESAELESFKSKTVVKSTPVFDSLPSYNELSKPSMTYAGIGTREAPKEILAVMTKAAEYLQQRGFTLQTGFTYKDKVTNLDEEGSDKAFSDGSKSNKVLFGPYGIRVTINGVTTKKKYDFINDARSRAVVQEIHPAPDRLSEGAMRLMARNTSQVFGINLDTPVDFVLFYAKEVPGSIRPEGGTGQAVQMARMKGIPTINMANPNWRQELTNTLDNISRRNNVIKPDGLPPIQDENQDSC